MRTASWRSAPCVPIFGDMTSPVFDSFPPETMKPGDLYWYNDCYGSRGAVSHSNDQVLLAPVFHEGRRCAFVMSWAHFADIGGLRPGSISPGRDRHFPGRHHHPADQADRCRHARTRRRSRSSTATRASRQSRGDMRALMASVESGRAARRRDRGALRRGRRGRRACASCSPARGGLVRDAAAPRPSRRARTASPTPSTPTATATGRSASACADARDGQDGDDRFMLRRHGDRRPGARAGQFPDEPGRARHGAGPVLSRRRSARRSATPAARGARRGAAARGLAAVAALSGAARHARPHHDARARGAERPGQRGRRQGAGGALGLCHHACMRGTSHRGRRAEPFLLADGIGVGYGARPFADGIDAVYFVAQENYPVEFLELGYPVRLRRYGIVAGQRRRRAASAAAAASCANTRSLAEDAVLAMRIDSVKYPPWGIAGGMSGGTGRAVVNPGTPQERVLAPLSDGNGLVRGDILRIETGGGGGHGHPLRPPPRRCWTTCSAALSAARRRERDYGVVLAGNAVDDAATARARAIARPPVKAFPPPGLCRCPRLKPPVRRGRYRRHLHRHLAARPATGRGLACQDAERAVRSLAGLHRRHRCWRWTRPGARRPRSATCCMAPRSRPT